MLEHLGRQEKLTINQWKIFTAATIGDMLDFFDFLLIAFVLAFIVKRLASDLRQVGSDTACIRSKCATGITDLGLGSGQNRPS
jgi:hypothetical protein